MGDNMRCWIRVFLYNKLQEFVNVNLILIENFEILIQLPTINFEVKVRRRMYCVMGVGKVILILSKIKKSK